MTTTQTEYPERETIGPRVPVPRRAGLIAIAVLSLTASVGCCRWFCRDDAPSGRSFRYDLPPAVIPEPAPAAGAPPAR